MLYPANLSFKNEEELNTFSDKQILRKFSTSRSMLKEMLKNIYMP